MKRRPDFLIFFATVTLLGFGIIMVFSASSVAATTEFGDSFHYLKKQAVATVIGLVGMWLFMHIDYHRLRKWAPVALVTAVALLGLVLVKNIGVEGGGATRWLELGPFNLQPSEVAKVSIVLFLASILSGRQNKITDFWRGLFPLVTILGALFLLILRQPDLGTAMILTATAAVMLYAAGAKTAHLVSLAILVAPGLWWVIMGEDYRRRRFLAFLNPEADPQDTGFHIIQSLYALGSGGLLGTGLGQSRQKFFWLPERHTDFIFAIIGEELGSWEPYLCWPCSCFWPGAVAAPPCWPRIGSVLARYRHCGHGEHPGVGEHRCGYRLAPYYRYSAAVHQLRRVVAGVLFGGHRGSAQYFSPRPAVLAKEGVL